MEASLFFIFIFFNFSDFLIDPKKKKIQILVGGYPHYPVAKSAIACDCKIQWNILPLFWKWEIK